MINDTCDILKGSIYLYSFKNLTYGLRFLNSSNTFQEIKIMRICPIHFLPSSHPFGYCPVIQILSVFGAYMYPQSHTQFLFCCHG